MPKKKKTFVGNDFIFNELRLMLENDEDNTLADLEGCCGIGELRNFPEPRLHDIAGEANGLESDREAAKKRDGACYDPEDYDDENYVPVTYTEIKKTLKSLRYGGLLATTIPSQRWANSVLPLVGFRQMETVTSKTSRSKITVWFLKL